MHGPDGRTTEEALNLYDMVNDSALDALPDFLGMCGEFEESVEPFVASARKDNPLAALFHRRGPRRAGALPGWAGDALLTRAELCERLSGISNALGPSGAERDQVLARITDWLDEADPEPCWTAPCGCADRRRRPGWRCCGSVSGSAFAGQDLPPRPAGADTQ